MSVPSALSTLTSQLVCNSHLPTLNSFRSLSTLNSQLSTCMQPSTLHSQLLLQSQLSTLNSQLLLQPLNLYATLAASWRSRDGPAGTTIPAPCGRHRASRVWQAVPGIAGWPERRRRAADRQGAAPVPLR